MTRPRTDPSSPPCPRRPPARLRRLGRVAAALAGSALLAVPASASAVSPALSPARTISVPTMVVLDASGSMNENDAPGPRIDAAKKAVTSLVTGLPADSRIGLTVYGTGTGSTRAEKTKGCTDIRTLVPVGPLDANRLRGAVASVTASGYTPIGNALKTAATALPTEGPRAIVLVSDGIDTCAPPAPCDIATQLERQGVDLTIHTVGFKVDPTARAQLSCIADATGGTYSDAGDADTLEQALKVKVDYAITGYQARGTRVTGADTPSATAPALVPGQYLDTLARAATTESRLDGTSRYYRVPVTAGATTYVSATVVPPTTSAPSLGNLAVRVVLLGRDGAACDQDRDVTIMTSANHAPVTAVLEADVPTGALIDGRCEGLDDGDGTRVVQVQRYGAAFEGQSLPVELVVRSEPAADTSRVGPPFRTDQPAVPVTAGPRSSDRPVSAGTGFNDAAVLAGGQTYTGTVVSGEDRFFAVPLEWGQRLSYSVEEVGPPRPRLAYPGSYANVSLYNPVRQAVQVDGRYTNRFWFTGSPAEPLAGTSSVPVRWTNRAGGYDTNAQIDGLYYLRLFTSFPVTDDGRSQTTYRITVAVDGAPEAGPVYRPGSTGVPTGSASSTPSSTASSTSPSTPTSTPSTPADGATTGATGTVEASGTTGSPSGGPGWAVVGGVALAALGGALVALLVRRARRGQPPTGSQT